MHPHQSDHFKGKSPLAHVAETQAEGILASSELHGLDMPGHLAALFDAMRETGVLFLFLSFLFPTFTFLVAALLGWIVWKTGRGALLGWARLERLHRVVAQEKWEIEHHRSQEREELAELYRAKGFQGALLEEVLDVLMADNERLLRVMVEEELKLSVHNQEHPLKLGLGAFIGALLGGLPFLGMFWITLPSVYSILGLSSVVVGVAAAFSSYLLKNHLLPAIVWNTALLTLSWSFLFFLFYSV